MKVLITGGAGYIGSHANRYFAEKGVETVVLDDLSAGHGEAVTAGRLVKGRVGDSELLRKLFAEERFDAVIHFAALADVGESVTDPSAYYRNNVVSMITLLDRVVEAGIKYFVFSSSAAVFGEPEYVPMDEEHPKRPINPYGETKLIGEHLLRDYERAYGLRYCAMRYFNAAGASGDGLLGESHSPEHHLIPLVQAAAARGAPFSVFGTDYPTRDGSCLRDFVHVEDLARAHYLGLMYIMEHDCSEAFNLGSSNGFTVKEVVEEAGRTAGSPIPYKVGPRRDGDPAALLASIEKAERLLGWRPEKSDLGTILGDAWGWERRRRF